MWLRRRPFKNRMRNALKTTLTKLCIVSCLIMIRKNSEKSVWTEPQTAGTWRGVSNNIFVSPHFPQIVQTNSDCVYICHFVCETNSLAEKREFSHCKWSISSSCGRYLSVSGTKYSNRKRKWTWFRRFVRLFQFAGYFLLLLLSMDFQSQKKWDSFKKMMFQHFDWLSYDSNHRKITQKKKIIENCFKVNGIKLVWFFSSACEIP